MTEFDEERRVISGEAVEGRERPLFFAQREAIETAVWLTQVVQARLAGILVVVGIPEAADRDTAFLFLWFFSIDLGGTVALVASWRSQRRG